MVTVLLFWSTVINTILGTILRGLAFILNGALEFLFTTVLGPLLKWVLVAAVPFIWDIIMEGLGSLLYTLVVQVLKLTDMVQILFDVLIGIRPVIYHTASGVDLEEPILDVLFNLPFFQNAFMAMIILAAGFTILFCILGVASSSFDITMEGKRPVNVVVKSFFKTMVMLVMMPGYVLVAIKISSIILVTIDEHMLASSHSSLGCIIFLVSTMDAAKKAGFNDDPSFEDEVRAPFFSGASDYTNQKQVEESFNLAKFNVFVGVISSLGVLWVMICTLLVFIQRIYDVMVLVVVSPFFVCTMPIDDGNNYNKWKEMFIAKLFTGFGSAIMMRIYLLLLPILMNSNIDFAPHTALRKADNFVIKLLFILGGAWTIFKSAPMFATMLNMQAGMAESGARDFVHGAGSSLKQRFIDAPLEKRKKAKADEKAENIKKRDEEFSKKSDATEKFGNFDERENKEYEIPEDQKIERPPGVNNRGIVEGSERVGFFGNVYGSNAQGKEVKVSSGWGFCRQNYSYDNDGNRVDKHLTFGRNNVTATADGKLHTKDVHFGNLVFSRQANGERKLTQWGANHKWSHYIDENGKAQVAYKTTRRFGILGRPMVKRMISAERLREMNERGAANRNPPPSAT